MVRQQSHVCLISDNQIPHNGLMCLNYYSASLVIINCSMWVLLLGNNHTLLNLSLLGLCDNVVSGLTFKRSQIQA